MAAADRRVTIVGGDGRSRGVSLDSYLDAEAVEACERDANAWIKSLRHVRIEGVALRDRFTYRGDSMWWFVEIYLHKQRTIVALYRAIRALENLVAREHPARVVAEGDPILQVLLPQVAARHRLDARAAGPVAPFLRDRIRLILRSRFYTIAALADRLRPGVRPPERGDVQVAAFVHSAFWNRDRQQEGYVGSVLKALQERLPPGALALVGLGPRTAFRGRGWRHRLAEFNDPQARELPLVPIESFADRRAIRTSVSVWRDRSHVLRALSASDEMRRAAVVEGYDVWAAVRSDLLGVSHLQMPWSARSMDEAGAALDALRPRAILTYAEAGGWGRALALEARRRGVPTVGLQHGFIYRHWLNYLHEPDEMVPSPANAADAGFPRPDLTLVYDGFARLHLLEAGRFPPSAVEVTGSPRLESFAEAGRRLNEADRARIRAGAGAIPGRKLIVLATKFSQIGDWFRPLVAAVASMPDAHLAVKCHPAETAAPYEAVAGATPNVRVLPARADLGSLVASADLVVTVNSTAAIEAMAVDVPGLVLALPNNLSPFVRDGALAGVERPEGIATALHRLLYDQGARLTLAERRRAFVERYGMVSVGGAASRAADAVLRLAASSTARAG